MIATKTSDMWYSQLAHYKKQAWKDLSSNPMKLIKINPTWNPMEEETEFHQRQPLLADDAMNNGDGRPPR